MNDSKLFYYLRALTTALLSITFAVAVEPLAGEGSTGFYVLLLSIMFAVYSCSCLFFAGRQEAA